MTQRYPKRPELPGLAMIAIALALVAALLASERVRCEEEVVEDVPFAWVGTRSGNEAKIVSFLQAYFSKCNPNKLLRALDVVPTLLDVTEKENVNPFLISSIVTLESTWNYSALGQLGEIGLMQTNGYQVDKDDPASQLEVGIGVLKRSFEKCGTTIGAVSLYATGRGCKTYKGAILRVKLAKKIRGVE